MNCAEFRERHLDVVEGTAPPLVEARLRAHARNCAECGRILEESSEFLALVGEAVREGPSLDWNFTRRVIDALPNRPLPRKSPWRRAYERTMPALAAAALVALCVALALSPRLSPVAMEFASDYTLVFEDGTAPILGAAFDELRAGDVVETPPRDVAGLSLPGGRIGIGPRSRVRVAGPERFALLRGEAVVRTSSSAPGLVLEAAGAALEVEPGSLVRVEVAEDPVPNWTAEVAEGGLREGGSRFGPGSRARFLGEAGVVATSLTPSEVAALPALSDRRPERESAAEFPHRDDRPPALESLLASEDAGGIARDAALARLGDAAATARIETAARGAGSDADRALAALAVLDGDARRDAARRLAGCAPVTPAAVSDLAAVLASADPVAAEKTVSSWVDATMRDRSPRLAAEEDPDPSVLASIHESECRALLAALRLANGESDPDSWLEAARTAEERLERLLLATLSTTRDPKHLPLWKTLLRDPDPRRQELGARGLRFVGDPESADVLLAALESGSSSDEDARVAIVAALADLRRDRRFDGRIAAALEGVLAAESDARLLRFAARGIALRHPFAGRDALEAVLAHEEPAVRLAAAEAAFSPSAEPVPADLVAAALRHPDTTTASLAVAAALDVPSPEFRSDLEAIVLDRRHSRAAREMALEAWVLSGAAAGEVADAATRLLAEPNGDATHAWAGPVFTALSSFPPGSVDPSRGLVGAARLSLLEPSEAMAAARALRTLGATAAPAELAAARERAVGDDRLYFAIALAVLGDDAGIADVLYRLEKRQTSALTAVSALRGLSLAEPIADALADAAKAADPDLAFVALCRLSEFDPERAANVARLRRAGAATAFERLDAALVMSAADRAAAAPELRESILEDPETLALVARRFELTEAEARARAEEWTAGPTPAGDRVVKIISSWRTGRSALSRSLAAEERAELDRRVRRIEACLVSLDATRARFLGGLSAEAAYGSPDQRRMAVAALAAMSDAEAAELLAALRERGDAAVRAAIESAVGREAFAGAPHSAHHEAARAALHEWIEGPDSPK